MREVWHGLTLCVPCRSCTGGKTEDFQAAAKLLHKAGGEVKVPTFLVPATQKVCWPARSWDCKDLRLQKACHALQG